MTRILIRGDLATTWTSTNPVLMEREIGIETDTDKIKIGDGASAWNTLPYATLTPAEIIALVAGYAPLSSPTFTGDPKAPTPATADNDTSIATTAFVKAQGYAPLASPTFTGDPKAPTPATADSDTSVATTAFVKAVLAGSPVLGGNPTAPTPTAGDNDTSIATTAFVKTALGLFVPYTPAVTGMTVGASTISGSYARMGDTVKWTARLVLGAGFAFTGGAPTVSLPVTAIAGGWRHAEVTLLDAGTGTWLGAGSYGTTTCQAYTTGYVTGGATGQYASISATLPFTWAVGDAIEWHGECRVA